MSFRLFQLSPKAFSEFVQAAMLECGTKQLESFNTEWKRVFRNEMDRREFAERARERDVPYEDYKKIRIFKERE